MRVGHPDIDIETDIKEDPMPARFDRRLISQGLQNIIKNASEAIAAVPAYDCASPSFARHLPVTEGNETLPPNSKERPCPNSA